MIMNKYVVKNNISGIANQIHLARTDGEIARSVTAEFSRIPKEQRTYDMNDFSILRIGTFDTETLDETILDNPELVPFDNRYISEHNGVIAPSVADSEINSIK